MPAAAQPEVTVVMPLLRPHPRYFPEAVESIRAQTLTDWELVIVEDPSEASARDYLQTLDDPRIIHLANAQRTGPAAQRTQGLRAARSELVALMDADDIAEPERLARQAAFLAEHPQVVVVGGQLTIIDSDGRPYALCDYPCRPDEIAAAMRRFNALAHPSVMLRRSVVLQAGSYAPEFVAVEDYDLWCRLLEQGGQLANLPDRLLRYRRHRDQIKSRQLRHTIRETLTIKRRRLWTQMSWSDRLRCRLEQTLLLLPAAWVLALFARLRYRPLESGRPGPAP